jgi:hypothetical protein
MTPEERIAARLAANAASKDFAENDGERWAQDEVDLLMTWDRSDEELTEMALILGRTREACRERYYLEKRKEATPTKTVTRTRTETVVTNYYANWDPEDVSPWYR